MQMQLSPSTMTASPAEPAYLSADEVRALIVDKTIEVQDPQGTTFRVYFSPDGRRLALQGNAEYALPWRILPDGTHCVTAGTGDDCARIARNSDGSYARYRDGVSVHRWMKFLPGKALVNPPQAPGIHSRATGPNQYEILGGNPGLTERQARIQVATVAQSLCGKLVPVLGPFQFEANERIPDAGNSGGSRSFRFAQQVSCVPGVKQAPAERRPTLRSADEVRRAEEEIRTRTEAYFRLLAANRLDEAYAQVDRPALAANEESWKRDRKAFQALAGEPLQLTIVEVTVYDNPQEAPEPGLYVAADFSNAYRNVPFQCGYLMWFRPINGEFRVTREETGYITAEQLMTTPAAQLPEIKRRLRCPVQ
jgi:hypothetical protein